MSFPGLGLILDFQGVVVAAHGAIVEADAVHVAATLGAHGRASIESGVTFMGGGYELRHRPLGKSHRLVIAVPSGVMMPQRRIERAARLLERMLMPHSPRPASGSAGGSGPAQPG